MALGLGALFGNILKLGVKEGAKISLANKLFGKPEPRGNELLDILQEDRQRRAIEFFGGGGGPDYYQDPADDAPNIMMPEPLIQTPTNSIVPTQTIIPEVIEAPRGAVDRGLAGIYAEIDRINANIASIAQAMVQSAILEKKYRDEMIKDREELLAQRGKARSQRRATRRRSRARSFFTRPFSQAKRKAGGVTQGILEAGLFGLALEMAAFVQQALSESFKDERPVGDAPPVEPGSAEEIRLATGILTEGSGAQDQADILQVIANRMKATGKTSTEVLAAPGQFAGVFDRFGPDQRERALEAFQEIQSIEDAARFLGISVAEAEKRIKQTLGNLKNREALERSRRDIGGATQFRGSPATVKAVNEREPGTIQADAEGYIPNTFYRGQGGNQFLTGPSDPKIQVPADPTQVFRGAEPLPPPQETSSAPLEPMSTNIAMAAPSSIPRGPVGTREPSVTVLDRRVAVALRGQGGGVAQSTEIPDRDPGGGGLYEQYMGVA
jgi:hypothetical protein